MIPVLLSSLLVALSGAMAPGPLLTYTIMQTIRQERRGYLVGFWVVLGHALLEGLLIFLLLSGAAFFFTSPLFSRIVGPLGGIFLAYLGITLVHDVVRNRVALTISPVPQPLPVSDSNLNLEHKQTQASAPGTHSEHPFLNHPLLAGIFVSMSNPYWWGWWAAAGLGLMVQLEISFVHWPNLLAFFLGHEAGDFLWYVLVSVLVYHSRHWLTERLYKIVLLVCSVVMIGFGLYLGIKPFVNF